MNKEKRCYRTRLLRSLDTRETKFPILHATSITHVILGTALHTCALSPPFLLLNTRPPRDKLPGTHIQVLHAVCIYIYIYIRY
ncbi:hypothetical protein BX666DRAFT_1946622 [Dichotomocladium elegans]|nr:hypothetical protein BX666DRAFT_1946622 [Dichotomocladium elegans]